MFQIDNMFALINVDEGRIEALRETKQEINDLLEIYKISDRLEGKHIKYIIRKENNI